VQHREGGIVKAVLVKEGQYVRAGSTLVELGDEAVAATFESAADQLDAESAKAARLEAESAYATAIAFPSALRESAARPAAASAMQVEQAAFLAKREGVRAQRSLLEEQADQIKQEIGGLERQAHAKQAATGLMQQEVRTYQSLSDVGFVSNMQVLRLRRNLQDYEAQRSEYLSNIARARQRLTDLAARSSALDSEYRQSAADQLPATRARIAALEQQLRSSRDAARRQAIVAPISGKIVDLKVFTVGGVIAQGAALMDIVPEVALLIIEARLNVDDVAQAQVGMQAEVRFPAYPARTVPLMNGELRHVAADRSTDVATGQPYYLAQIAMTLQTSAVAQDMLLRPGMSAEIFLLTHERTPLQYLIEPIRNSMRRALRQSV
jgi:membrane fusion protein, epimerase transport system